MMSTVRNVPEPKAEEHNRDTSQYPSKTFKQATSNSAQNRHEKLLTCLSGVTRGCAPDSGSMMARRSCAIPWLQVGLVLTML